MNKPRNQFAALPEQDRQFIIDLCASHPYEEAVLQLAKPRAEGGLAILTSKSALCRFYTNAQPDQRIVLLAQAAAAAQVRHEQHSNAFLGAIRAAVEARIFENLQLGKALVDMEKDFRLLKTAQQLYLADACWRAGNPAARAAYQEHVDRCAQAPEDDFIPVEESAQSSEPIVEPSRFERDVAQAREKKLRDEAHRQEILAILNSAKTNPTPKSPVIPPIPLNSTSPAPLPQAIATAPQTATPPSKVSAPPAAKIGRNDPCPCGSGGKYKKCCLVKSPFRVPQTQ